MSKFFNKILCLFIILIIVLQFSVYAKEFNWIKYQEPLYSKASFVIDKDSNVILHEYNADAKMYPASLTKIMTAIVVLDKVENLDEMLTFSYNAVNKDIDKHTTTIGASAGDRLSVRECLYAILLPSANDAANALAEHVAGSISDFSLLMNEKAFNIGMTNTNFVNPTGLHNDEQYTTARDIGIMMSYAMNNSIFVQISSSISYKHAPIRRYKDPNNSNNTMLNTNSMLAKGNKGYYEGTLAGKTGYTKEAGYNLVSCVQKGNARLIVVDLGCKKIDERFDDAKKLYDFYFKNYNSLPIKDYDYRFNKNDSNISVKGVILVNEIRITVDDYAHITLPKDASFDDTVSNITFQTDESAPSNAIGMISYTLDGINVGKCYIVGKDSSGNDYIWTSYLNSSAPVEVIKDSQNSLYTYMNEDSLIYINNNGVLVVSDALLIVLRIVLFILIVISIIMIVNSRYVKVLLYGIMLKYKKETRHRRSVSRNRKNMSL